jgi:hypothetical protein
MSVKRPMCAIRVDPTRALTVSVRPAEDEFAEGGPPMPTITRLRALFSDGPAAPPSVRTMRRWHRERRWLEPTR